MKKVVEENGKFKLVDKEVKYCLHCGKEFKDKKQKFCSKQCKINWEKINRSLDPIFGKRNK